MTTWTPDEIDAVGRAHELDIATRRTDGSLRRSVIVWAVRHGPDLYVRSVNGRGSAWFRGVADRHEGHISSGGVDRDVAFLDIGDELADALDAAYRAKYGATSSAVAHITSSQARAATLRLVPR